MFKKIAGWLGALAALITILAFFFNQVLQNEIIAFLKTSISLPIWIIAIIIILFAISILILLRKKPKHAPFAHDYSILHESPHKITSDRKESATPISSKIIKSPQGSFATWVYLHPFGEGLRKLVNNRYIVAHDTNKGVAKQIGEQKLYVNVFALSRGPKIYNPPDHPIWKLWLANGQGEKRIWEWEDSEELKPGWHHLLVRWDHARPLLEFVIDGNIVIQTDNYRKYWPKEYDDKIMVGTWSGRGKVHYIETNLWRSIPYESFLDDVRLKCELALPRPKPSL